ncbi:MAG TPA: OmpA family protein [Bacteroidales bacterium]|nr:OmpA family protein [Bacteroidales bacterium]HPS61552.1 OmpA family protein [Bacteroidales bacterium]
MIRTKAIPLFIFLLLDLLTALPGYSQKQKANEKFGLYRYGEAVSLYRAYLQKKPGDAEALRNLALSCSKINNITGAVEAYRSLVKLDGAEPDDWYRYAQVLRMAGDTAEARRSALAYQGKAPGERAENLLHSLDQAAALMSDSNRYILTNQTRSYNFSVFSPVLGSGTVVVTAGTGEGIIDPWTGRGVTRLFATDTSFSRLVPFAPEVMTGAGDGIATFAPDGKVLYFTTVNPKSAREKGVDTRRLMIVSAVKNGSEYRHADLFPFNSPSFSSAHPALWNKGSMLVFASDRPGGKGGMDLWCCTRQPGGTWGEPVNIAVLNTAGNELFPVFNGSYLYFSSDGLPGLGGLDLFRSKVDGTSFSPPENLKAPINSAFDDFSLVTEDNLRSGWISTNRFGNPEKDDIARFLRIYQQPAVKEVIAENKEPEDNKPQPSLSSPAVGKTIRLEKILYEFDRCDITPASAEELDRLVKLMNDYSDMVIELSSHTDCRGTVAYNERLSQCRADAAVRYIVGKGITRDRIRAKGYGESRLVNGCSDGVNCTEEQHRENRRTEFTILSCPSCPPLE